MRQNISKDIMEFALCWPFTAGPGPPLRMVCTLSQAPCRKLSFLWEWLTEIALGLEMGACVHFLSQHWDLICLAPCMLQHSLSSYVHQPSWVWKALLPHYQVQNVKLFNSTLLLLPTFCLLYIPHLHIQHRDLEQCFSAFQMLWSFNAGFLVVVTPNKNYFLGTSQMQFCYCYESYHKCLICRISDTQAENLCSTIWCNVL